MERARYLTGGFFCFVFFFEKKLNYFRSDSFLTTRERNHRLDHLQPLIVNIANKNKVRLLMQAPPTDTQLDESTSTLRPTTEDVRKQKKGARFSPSVSVVLRGTKEGKVEGWEKLG